MSDFKDRVRYSLLGTASNRYINLNVVTVRSTPGTNEVVEGWLSSIAFTFAANVSGIIGIMIQRDGLWSQLATNTLSTESDSILVDNIYVKSGDRLQINFGAGLTENVNVWLTTTYEPVGTGPTWTDFAFGLIEQSSSSSSGDYSSSSSSSSSSVLYSSFSSSSSVLYSSSSSSSSSDNFSSSSSSNGYSSSSSSSSTGCFPTYCAEGFNTTLANGNYADRDTSYNSKPTYANGSYFIWYESVTGYWAMSNTIGDPQNQWISSIDVPNACPNGVWSTEDGVVYEGSCVVSSSSSSSNQYSSSSSSSSTSSSSSSSSSSDNYSSSSS